MAYQRFRYGNASAVSREDPRGRRRVETALTRLPPRLVRPRLVALVDRFLAARGLVAEPLLLSVDAQDAPAGLLNLVGELVERGTRDRLVALLFLIRMLRVRGYGGRRRGVHARMLRPRGGASRPPARGHRHADGSPCRARSPPRTSGTSQAAIRAPR